MLLEKPQQLPPETGPCRAFSAVLPQKTLWKFRCDTSLHSTHLSSFSRMSLHKASKSSASGQQLNPFQFHFIFELFETGPCPVAYSDFDLLILTQPLYKDIHCQASDNVRLLRSVQWLSRPER